METKKNRDISISEVCVMVSPIGIDEPNCLNNLTNYQCRTLSYVFRHMKNVVCLAGTHFDLIEYIEMGFDEPMLIIHGHSGPTFKNSQLYLVNYAPHIVKIIFHGISFDNCMFYLRNVHVIFEKCLMSKSGVTAESERFATNIIQISVIQSKLTGNIRTTYFDLADNSDTQTSVKVIILDSEIISYPFSIRLSELVLIILNSTVQEPSINLNIKPFLKTLFLIHVENTTIFEVSKPIPRRRPRPRKFMVIIENHHGVYVSFYGCIFIGVPLTIAMQETFLLNGNDEPVGFVKVGNCSFQKGNNKDEVNGGGGAFALRIKSHNNIKFKMFDCTFLDNQALGQGGAIFISSVLDSFVSIHIIGCNFINNKSPESGTAIYISEGTMIHINLCTFQYDISPLNQDILPIVTTEGELNDFEADFHISNDNLNSPGGRITVFDVASTLRVKIDMTCPLWHQHENKYTISQTLDRNKYGKTLLRFTYDCVPCSEGLYIGLQESQNFRYSRKGPLDFSLVDIDRETCKRCPYGGHCTGTKVVPRANYWGYWHNNKLMFQQCPPSYCCSGDTNEPCLSYDYCKGNRTGTLCGNCQDGFSLSILKGTCTHDSECGGNHWFWFMALTVTFAYAIWYTFKDDMFKLVTLCMKRIKIRKMLHGNGKNEYVNQKATNKGYFGIISNYIQLSTVIAIHIEFDDIDKSKSVLDTLSENVGKFFGIELSNLSLDICPLLGVTTLWKNVFRFGFLYGIYLSWLLIYLSGKLLIGWVRRNKIMVYSSKNITSFESKMLQGIVEIIKYTYTGICEIVFMSLTCVRIRDNYVWWYDASNTCIEIWQIVFIVFAVWFILPFPPALFLGMKLLTQQIIGPKVFIAYCLCPLLGLIIHLLRLHKLSQPKNEKSLTPETSEILSILQGPYRHSDKYPTLYWEAMISLRRLFIAAMTLIGYASIRMMFIVCLCITFSF